METFFLVCFVFGALFTVVSFVLGFVGTEFHAEIGHGHGHGPGHGGGHGHGGDLGHGHGHGHDHGDSAHHGDHSSVAGTHSGLPVFNVSSMMAFLTWFGASGYLLMHFAGWSALAALPVSLLPGALAAVLIALFLGKIMAGERVMRPADYQLEGTIGRVTVSIPANGVGEIVFSKGGTRRSEAARSLSGRAIAYNEEIVIVEYQHGVALVQTWNEMLGHPEREALSPGGAPFESSAER